MKIGIIGAGITGLSAAHELTKLGHNVIVFERSDIPGGLGTYIPVGGNYIERFYHHFFQTDKFIINLAKELQIDNKLKYYPSKTGILSGGKIYPFSSPKDLLFFTPLSFIDRIRCGITLGFMKVLPVPLLFLDKISAEKLIKKYAGENVYKKVWGPLLEGKFSAFAGKVSSLWLWGRIYDRSFKLGYFDGSVKILFDKLIEKIKINGGEIKLNAEVTAIKTNGEKVEVVEKNKKYIFDKVIITTVSPIAEKLLGNELPAKFRTFLKSIDHLGAVCLILELDHSIQSQYWVNICQEQAKVLVMVEHTNMLDKKDYMGRTIIYLANYIHRSDKRYTESDESVIKNYTSILKAMNKNFKTSWIKKTYVTRIPRTQTIFEINAMKKIPPIKLPMKNVFMVNIDQMYPHDRNLSQGVELGIKVTKEIFS